MNIITFDVKTVPGDASVEIDGLKLSGVMYLLAYVDGQNIIEGDSAFYGSFIVWDELKKSSLCSGDYLIFTSVSGVADDAGWDYVQVRHDVATVSWRFYINEDMRQWTFSRASYMAQIEALSRRLDNRPKDCFLEPRFVIYPESD
jgi:hypothetical protein